MTQAELYKKVLNEEIQFTELFSDSFMRKNTRFSSFSSFEEELQERGSKGKCSQEKILERVVVEKTDFKNFEKMRIAAIEAYCTKN